MSRLLTGGISKLAVCFAVSFSGAHLAPRFVDLSERSVLMHMPCLGHVNRDPGDWNPEGMPAQLILYDDDQPMFSILFEDSDQYWQHMMDFRPVAFSSTSDRAHPM